MCVARISNRSEIISPVRFHPVPAKDEAGKSFQRVLFQKETSE